MKIITPLSITLADSNVAPSSYADWSSSTAYTVGQNVYLPSNYGEYVALTNNTNKDPSLNASDWKFIGTSNRYKMLDQFLNTQTTNTGTIEVEIVAYASAAIYLGNLECNSVEIDVVDNDSLNVIESAEYKMFVEPTDWLDYFFGVWMDERKTSITYERTTLARNITYLIKIDNGTATAKCGILAAGALKKIGSTRYEFNIGALDYSTVAIDTASGVTYLAKGNYAKRISADIFTYTKTSEQAYKVLTDIRGTPVVFINGGFEDFNVYGYLQKFETLVKGPVETAITIDIVGLI